MTASIEVTIDAVDADPVASFWEAALGYDRLYEREPYIVLGPPPGDPRPRLVIQRVPSVTSDKAPVHMDLRVDDPDAEVARLQGLGASVEWVVDETPSGFIRWTTMADPQGTLFCVCPSRKERSEDDRGS
jgi:predicted enzyme related to lactoylglutathione lyase